MGNIRQSSKQLAAVATAFILSMGAAVLARPITAHAAVGCSEGSRATAQSIAASGDFVEAQNVWMDSGKVTLRYSSETGCMWGLISDLGTAADNGLQVGEVWLDRSTNGGATWQGKLGDINTGGNKRSTYTGTYNTIGYNAVRACGVNMYNVAPVLDPRSGTPSWGPIYCTGWFWPSRLQSSMFMGGRGFSSLSSPNNRYVLRMQTDGNLVLYSSGRAVWASNTYAPGSIVWMQGDGNLVIVAPGNHPIWSSGSRAAGSILSVQDDGNVVIVAPGNHPVWATGTNGR